MDMTTTTAPAARNLYRVLGTTDEVTECEHCGRVELKGTVVLGVLDEDGNVEDRVYFGAVCGARAAGWTTKDVRKAAAAADRAAAAAEREARRAEADARLVAALALRLTADCPTLPTLCRRESARNGVVCAAHS